MHHNKRSLHSHAFHITCTNITAGDDPTIRLEVFTGPDMSYDTGSTNFDVKFTGVYPGRAPKVGGLPGRC